MEEERASLVKNRDHKLWNRTEDNDTLKPMDKVKSALRPWFWIIGALLIILVTVAVGRSPLYRGFVTGQLLADLKVQEIQTNLQGSLLNVKVIINHTGESLKPDFFIVAGKAALPENPAITVWEENGGVNVSDKQTAETYEANFTVPVSYDTYDFIFTLDSTDEIAEINEKNNVYTHRVTIPLP